ncbi:MAG TPA: sugar phosphate isomerase/epimerase family protein [Abditibacteriaceae bacterium]|jgi:sugar phosphate isomerase/epimerase
MFKTLSPGAINVSANTLQDAVQAARIGGFEGVEFNPREVADIIETQGIDAVQTVFSNAGIRPGGWGLPVQWRGEESAWRQSLEELPRLAKAASAIGGGRTMTWILPSSDELPLEENRRFHIERFKPVAQILADNGCSLGLEFIGPKTLRQGRKHEFIYTMQGMLDLGAEIGPNVGLLLDCWHWYTSGGTVDELRTLKPEQVVYVHVNDAPAGVALDEQRDNVRCLPGETGVIDIAAFLQTLQSIGYDGPVTPEPFKKELKDLPDDEARLKSVGASMDKIFQQAGL